MIRVRHELGPLLILKNWKFKCQSSRWIQRASWVTGRIHSAAPGLNPLAWESWVTAHEFPFRNLVQNSIPQTTRVRGSIFLLIQCLHWWQFEAQSSLRPLSFQKQQCRRTLRSTKAIRCTFQCEDAVWIMLSIFSFIALNALNQGPGIPSRLHWQSLHKELKTRTKEWGL